MSVVLACVTLVTCYQPHCTVFELAVDWYVLMVLQSTVWPCVTHAHRHLHRQCSMQIYHYCSQLH